MSYGQMYQRFRAAGMTHAGACGMLGNIRAESDGISNIVQRGMQHLSDEAYTQKFDSNPELMIRDGVGYGLCQWTFWSRKQALSDYAKRCGVSVGNQVMQCAFICEELKQDFHNVWNVLCSTDDYNQAADIVCSQYEKPAVNNYTTRRRYAALFDEDFSNISTEKPTEKDLEKIRSLAAAIIEEIDK